MSSEKKRVIITGSSGRIGRAAVEELQARGHDVRGFDRIAHPTLKDQVIGPLTDADAVEKAMQGCDTLIHLAATPDDDDFLTQLVPNNCIGVYNVLEAAQKARVKRLILASSGQVVWYDRLRATTPLGTDVQPTPRYWYASLKVFLEAAGRSFAEKFGMDVIAVRLGWCPRTGEHVEELRAAEDWARDVYLSPRDAGRFFACSVEAPGGFGYQVLYAISKPVQWARYDMDAARRLVGFEPEDQWPEGIEVIVS